MRLLVAELKKRRCAEVKRPRATASDRAGEYGVRAAVRREVRQRDGARRALVWSADRRAYFFLARGVVCRQNLRANWHSKEVSMIVDVQNTSSIAASTGRAS